MNSFYAMADTTGTVEAPSKQKRRMLAVTMKPELFKWCHAAADQEDIATTAWVRGVIQREHDRRAAESELVVEG